MIYLKKFNENLEDKPRFQLVSKDAAVELSIKKKIVDFTPGEVKFLSKLFDYSDLWKRTHGATITFGTSKIIKKRSCSVYISKYDDDYYIMGISPRDAYKEYLFVVDTRQGFTDLMSEINNMNFPKGFDSPDMETQYNITDFNESEKYKPEVYFSFVSQADYNKDLYSKSMINFSSDEIKKIRKYVFRPIVKMQTRKMILITSHRSNAKILKHYDSLYVSDILKGKLEIRKLTDDYFLINLRSAGSGTHYSECYVLCDTFRGVIQFLRKVKTAESDSIFYHHFDYKWQQDMLD